MKKKKKQLIVSIALIVILGVVAIYFISQKGGLKGKQSTLSEESTAFAIEDTSTVGKIMISDENRKKVELVKEENGNWKLNGKYKARPENIKIILETAKKIKVKAPVPNSAKNNIIKNIAVSFKKVEYFNTAGEWIKTWYVGLPTKDHESSYMILETPDEGKSEIPYITHIPGFTGELTSRFFCEEIDWRYTGIFSYDPQNIKSVRLTDYDSLEISFEINALDKDRFELRDHLGRKIPVFDTVEVRQYLVNFKKIHFENFNKGILNAFQEDSLRKAKPYYKLAVTDKQGEKKEITIFHKKAPPSDPTYDAPEFQYKWDPERAFAMLPTGEIVVIQFFVFDHVLWPVMAFTQSPRLMKRPG